MARSWQYIADLANKEKWAGDTKFEVTVFDNKGSPQESLTVLKSIIDQGFRYVAQGNGSGVAIALSDAITKHNERNPGKEIVYLNYAAVDPSLTNEKCSFWHFRLDINADMKMEALTAFMAKEKSIQKVYLINQDYAFGHSVEKAAEEYLKKKRPDVQVVGKDRHPLMQVRDFAPYIAKIKAAGADTVITGNWGSDLALMIKAANDAGRRRWAPPAPTACAWCRTGTATIRRARSATRSSRASRRSSTTTTTRWRPTPRSGCSARASSAPSRSIRSGSRTRCRA
jgi:branched-chain amino acid transport system substrate-binding protein